MRADTQMELAWFGGRARIYNGVSTRVGSSAMRRNFACPSSLEAIVVRGVSYDGLHPRGYFDCIMDVSFMEHCPGTENNDRGKDQLAANNVSSSRTARELLFRQFEQACEESGACKIIPPERNDIAKIRCIRECVSPSCYKEIYMFDQLEEGEIDVRLNSFKGCFMQRNIRPRK
ncbi:unnamed protein product [Xylocopa violacea]|uniref:Uncharacterized protein n=1 Tax=Xylocopa violacea TaxID=135666 RepID=A0ABP1P332_XYLVO